MQATIEQVAPRETIYGDRARFRFFVRHLEPLLQQNKVVRLVDLGCGTGEGTVFPLSAYFGRQIEITGVDSDAPSIAYASDKAKILNSTARFLSMPAEKVVSELGQGCWDAVIASEILEHCPTPYPVMTAAHKLLKPGGLLLVTVPNGYGRFETEHFFWCLLGLEHGRQALRRCLRSEVAAPVASPQTLNATNTHVAFYTADEIRQIFEFSGFHVIERQNRSWLCGPFSEIDFSLLSKIGLGDLFVAFAQALAPVVPFWMAADWAFAARKLESSGLGAAPSLPQGFLKSWWWKVKQKQHRELAELQLKIS